MEAPPFRGGRKATWRLSLFARSRAPTEGWSGTVPFPGQEVLPRPLLRNKPGWSVSLLVSVLALVGCHRPADAPSRNTPPAATREPEPEEATSSITEGPEENEASKTAPQQAEQPAHDEGPEFAAQRLGEGPHDSVSNVADGILTGRITGDAKRALVGSPGAPPQPMEMEEDQTKKRPPVPLVDDPASLQPLQPRDPTVWIDRSRRFVVMVGEVCQRRVPLELFACRKGSKEHESIVAVDSEAKVIHAALLATGAVAGNPVQFVPEFVPASGTEIEVTLVWEDESGRRRRARAQDWVRDVAEMYSMFKGVIANPYDEELNPEDQAAAWREMEYPWVFAGSQLLKDDRTGEAYYLADGEGDLICVSNFPSAVLDVPVRSSDSNAALLFEAFTERIPPLGTPVTLILTPKLDR